MIRAAIASAPPPVIEDRKCTVLLAFHAVTIAKIKQVVGDAPAKHGALDAAAPTWSVSVLC
jgi:hypothetical protein